MVDRRDLGFIKMVSIVPSLKHPNLEHGRHSNSLFSDEGLVALPPFQSSRKAISMTPSTLHNYWLVQPFE